MDVLDSLVVKESDRNVLIVKCLHYISHIALQAPLAYVAPELIGRAHGDATSLVTPAADMFSLGPLPLSDPPLSLTYSSHLKIKALLIRA